MAYHTPARLRLTQTLSNVIYGTEIIRTNFHGRSFKQGPKLMASRPNGLLIARTVGLYKTEEPGFDWSAVRTLLATVPLLSWLRQRPPVAQHVKADCMRHKGRHHLVGVSDRR